MKGEMVVRFQKLLESNYVRSSGLKAVVSKNYSRAPDKRGIEDNSKIIFLFLNENML